MEGIIKSRLDNIQDRVEITKHVKYKIINKENMTGTIKKQEKDYEFNLCDYCLEEIKITKKKDERDGGVIELKTHITGLNRPIKLALHTRCLNPVLNEFKKIVGE